MAAEKIQRLRFADPKGRMPTLQFCRPAELKIDPSYQRDISSSQSQALIRRIAQQWDWDLCQPLVVARRVDFVERLFVIDGQHRLAAARLRGDIDQLPCVIVTYASSAEEAASFVALNQQRQHLSQLDIFRAAVSSGDEEAQAIAAAIADAGLSIAPHTNITAWKPGMVSNIGRIRTEWRSKGPLPIKLALRAMGRAFEGQVLQYAGTIFPGVSAVCADIWRKSVGSEKRHFDAFVAMLASKSQQVWRTEIHRACADDTNLNYRAAAVRVLSSAWSDAVARLPKPAQSQPVSALAPAPASKIKVAADALAPRWCDQCQRRVAVTKVASCQSRFCALRSR